MPTAAPPRHDAPPAVTSAHRSRWRTAAEFLALAVVAVAGLELFLGACHVGEQEFLMPDPAMGCKHIPNQLVTWRLEGFSSERLSSRGLRDVEHALAKPAGLKRVALIGDSSTEGMQVPLPDTYARVLETSLNGSGPRRFEVINFACSSYSTGQQLLQLKSEVLAYEPDVIVLLYNRGDSIENVRDPAQRNPEPRPYFYLDSGALKTDNSVLTAHAARLTQSPLQQYLQRNSRIYGVFTQANLALSINEKLYRKLRGWVQAAASLVTGAREPRPPLPAYAPQDGWLVTARLIEDLSKTCRANGARFLVVTFPNTLGDPHFDYQTTELAKLAGPAGFSFLDLTPAFKAHNDPNSLFLQFHFSSAGHALTAAEVERALKGGLID